MNVLEKLTERWSDIDYPFLVHSSGELRFSEIAEQKAVDVSEVKSGDVVALIGDFDPQSILTLLQRTVCECRLLKLLNYNKYASV